MQEEKVKEVRVLKFNNGIARVTIPDLTKEEYNRRWRKVYKAAEELLKEQERVLIQKK